MPVLKYEFTPLFRLDTVSKEYFADFSEQQNVPLLGRLTFTEHFKRVCLHGKDENAYMELEY